MVPYWWGWRESACQSPAWRQGLGKRFLKAALARWSFVLPSQLQRGKTSLPFWPHQVLPWSGGVMSNALEILEAQPAWRRLPQAEPCGRKRRTETAWGNKHTNKPTNKGCVCCRERKGAFSSGPWAPQRFLQAWSSGQLSHSPWGPAFPKPPVTPGCSVGALELRPATSHSLPG